VISSGVVRPLPESSRVPPKDGGTIRRAG